MKRSEALDTAYNHILDAYTALTAAANEGVDDHIFEVVRSLMISTHYGIRYAQGSETALAWWSSSYMLAKEMAAEAKRMEKPADDVIALTASSREDEGPARGIVSDVTGHSVPVRPEIPIQPVVPKTCRADGASLSQPDPRERANAGGDQLPDIAPGSLSSVTGGGF